ncbi:MAG: hypothetical protein IBJ03_17565 [Gemmatimonadaceae bacterium]|nr:hypothetical protein [Gemmatimonadaceae bacterium]
MHVIQVDTPIGQMEPAPITSLPIHMVGEADRIQAFWTCDDAYVLRVAEQDGASAQWFMIEADATANATTPLSEAERLALGALMADIIPIGGHTVAFPVGSTGRRVYRVWRGAKSATGRKTKILGVRAARSRRLPA